MKGIKFLLITATALLVWGCRSSEPKNAAASQISEEDLMAGFQNPPQEARVQVWWHWMDGNITKDGIRKDLEWMSRSGIGGFHHFDAGIHMEPIVEHRLIYMHDDWKDAFKYAANLADSLGLDMTIASSPGWSATGGPWVKPENAMKKLIWRQVRVKGGQKVETKLPELYRTKGVFQNARKVNSLGFPEPEEADSTDICEDISVIAVKVPETDRSLQELGAKVSSSDPGFTVENLTDGDLRTGSQVGPNASGFAWVQYEFPEKVEIRSASVADGRTRGQWANAPADTSTVLESSDDGVNYTEITKIPATLAVQQTVSFKPVTAKYFRIRVAVLKPSASDVITYGGYTFKIPKTRYIPEFNLYPVERINHAEEKAGFAAPHDLHRFMTEDYGGQYATEVVDVTQFVKDGVLSWDAPEGNWKIYRFGWSLTGKKNGPAPAEATGLEVDKLDKDAYMDYFRYYFSMYKDASGGLIGEHGIRNILTDSYEAGIQNWTPKMIEKFKEIKHYDMTQWMPVLAGEIVESPEKSEQFLWDWRSVISELYADNYANIDPVAEEFGIHSRYTEAQENGRVYVADGMDVKRDATIPMSAIWVPTSAHGGSSIDMAKADIRESSSTAHVYGSNLTAAESLTVPGQKGAAYSFCPENLKPVVDIEFANGVNRIVIHESAHQPDDIHVPGTGLMTYGQWFNRHETWAEYARPWVDYMSRSSFMLMQGRNVAQIIYYYGEDSNITAEYGFSLPDVPKGYSYDFVNPYIILNELSVKDGKFVTTGGASYDVLVLDRNCERMSLQVLRKLYNLQKAGGIIVGKAPIAMSGQEGDKAEFDKMVKELWGDGKIGTDMAAALAKVPKDYDTDADNVSVVHRDLGDKQIWWVGNGVHEYKTMDISFNITGLKPEVWNPVDGSISDVTYSIENGRTKVTLDMTPDDALFVVFAKKAEQNSATVEKPEIKETVTVEGPWNVSFEGLEAPEPATFATLASYTENSNPAIKYFSGTATYSKKINVKTGSKVVLDLGSVKNLAEVIVNGKSLGVVWKEPFALDITSALKDGENELTIKVVNLWVNRLIGDEQPGARKYTYTPAKFFSAGDPLLPSGLLGPVTLKYE